jgi:hypothetical protein
MGRGGIVGLGRRRHRQDQCTGSASAKPGLPAVAAGAAIRSPTASRSSTHRTRQGSHPWKGVHRYTRRNGCAARGPSGSHSSAPSRDAQAEAPRAASTFPCPVWGRNELARAFCSSLRCVSANPDAGRRDQANLLSGIAIWSNACRLKRLTRLSSGVDRPDWL